LGTNCGRFNGLPHGRDKAELSTSPSHANLSTQWKQEVNRRVAAHLNRKTPLADEHEAAPETRPSSPASRAAQAAARVAARYAKAPSYSEMLASEARAAVTAAEAVSRAALEAQAAAESVLASIEAASSQDAMPSENPRATDLHLVSAETAEGREAAFVTADEEHFAERAFQLTPEPASLEPASLESASLESASLESASLHPAHINAAQPAPLLEGQAFAIRWEPDMPALRREAEVGRAAHAASPAANHAASREANHASGLFGSAGSDWSGPDALGFHSEEIAVVEPAQPIYANLIEFPRELVAARRVRPRLAEGPLAADEPGAQLSIFEVDPGAVSTEPEMASVVVEDSRSAWAEPEWSGIKLGAEPEEELLREPAPQAPAEVKPEVAPLSRRLLSIVFDVALIGMAFVTAATVAATRTAELPGLRAIEMGLAVALVIVAAIYHALFFTLAKATPGMHYARIRLCTFDGQIPTRAQRTARLVALLLSVAPVGLGIAWAIFDDDHLSWHDRLSRTYLRRY
jgi:uncharacterized RDD family membrane protein YckC